MVGVAVSDESGDGKERLWRASASWKVLQIRTCS